MAKLTSCVCVILLLTAQPLATQAVVCEIVGAAGGAAALVFGAPIVLTAAGFSAAGIAAGSLAAKTMSVAYTANVGLGVVSVLQSAGAAGLATSTIVAGGLAGAGHYAGSHAGDNHDEE